MWLSTDVPINLYTHYPPPLPPLHHQHPTNNADSLHGARCIIEGLFVD